MNFKEFQTEQKLRGGYYTPIDLADFLVRWVSHIEPKKILEPSCGDGSFIDAIAQHLFKAQQTYIELDTAEANKARQRLLNDNVGSATVLNDDFLGWFLSSLKERNPNFDAVVGNPPFIRYQYLPSIFQERASAIFDHLGCSFTKHTNAWVPFILASFELLRPGGRLAMVVPSEIINVIHAQPLRRYLGVNAKKIVIVDPKELWFEGTLQGAVLLLVEKLRDSSDRPEGLGVLHVSGKEFLSRDPEEIFRSAMTINGSSLDGKWTRAILPEKVRTILEEMEDAGLASPFQNIAEVDVGIVTGANSFFLVDDKTVEQHSLSDWVHPMFGRSQHCPGIIYDEAQHNENARNGSPTNFLWLPSEDVRKNIGVDEYLKIGEKQNLHMRYKTRIRKIWFSVPSVYSTEVGMLKRCHDAPKLILNEIKAFTTDTAYRIRTSANTSRSLVYAFLNPLTALSAELEGRYYGGGVLELVPSEIERLLIPNLEGLAPELPRLNALVKSTSMDEVLDAQARVVLGRLGISVGDQNAVLEGWKFLRDRRQRVLPAEAA